MIYRNVARTSPSHLDAHAGFFRFIVTFCEKVDFNYIYKYSLICTHNTTVCVIIHKRAYNFKTAITPKL